MQLAVISDLRKAVRIAREGKVTFIPRCVRENGKPYDWMIWPTRGDFELWQLRNWGKPLALDFETTYRGHILCLGMWPVENYLEDDGICIPFHSKGLVKYWKPEDELLVRAQCKNIIEQWPIIGHNWAGFDAQRAKDNWDAETGNLVLDTMVAHHLVMPELRHGLAFVSSLVTDLGPYKVEVHEGQQAAEEDDFDKWQNVERYDDYDLRWYCLCDTFATAAAYTPLTDAMEAPDQ